MIFGLTPHIWVSYFRSKLRRSNPVHTASAKEEIGLAATLSQEIMKHEWVEIFDAGHIGHFKDSDAMLTFELPFLWGVFRGLVQEYPDLPTNGYDRIKLHLIKRLMDAHGYLFEAARDTAILVEDQYNKADEQFEKLANAGEKTFHDKEIGRLLKLYKTHLGMASELEWSDNPGAHEAHLIRRSNGSYFPKSRQKVTIEELSKAKCIDNDDYLSAKQRFDELGKGINKSQTTGDLMALRERIDDVILYSMGVGGEAKDIASKADQLRNAVISDLQEAFINDEEALENIEKADIYHRDYVRQFYIPFIAQWRRENSPILEDDLVPSVLSEDPVTIKLFMNKLTGDTKLEFKVTALKVMQEALENGYLDPNTEAKMDALDGD